MPRRQRRVAVRVWSKMFRNEHLPWHLSHRLYDPWGLEQSFLYETLNHSFSFPSKVHGHSLSSPTAVGLKDIRLNLFSHSTLSLTFHATGHPAVLSTHRSTIEITKEEHLTAKGDCIVAVNSTIGPVDLTREQRTAIARSEAKIRLVLSVGQFHFTVNGEGDDRLDLSHPTDFVIRRSGFVSARTLMVHADKAAIDIPHEMVRLLRDPKAKVKIQILTSDD